MDCTICANETSPAMGLFGQWQVVQRVRFVPIRAVQAHDREPAGAWRAGTSGETVGRTRDGRPVPCQGRTCETDPNVREIPVRTCIPVTAYIIVRIVVALWPAERRWRSALLGRGLVVSPSRHASIGIGQVGMYIPACLRYGVSLNQQYLARRPSSTPCIGRQAMPGRPRTLPPGAVPANPSTTAPEGVRRASYRPVRVPGKPAIPYSRRAGEGLRPFRTSETRARRIPRAWASSALRGSATDWRAPRHQRNHPSSARRNVVAPNHHWAASWARRAIPDPAFGRPAPARPLGRARRHCPRHVHVAGNPLTGRGTKG